MDFTRATELTAEVEAAIEDAFEYHAWNEAQKSAGAKVRKALADAVKVVIANAPPVPGPDRGDQKNNGGPHGCEPRNY